MACMCSCVYETHLCAQLMPNMHKDMQIHPPVADYAHSGACTKVGIHIHLLCTQHCSMAEKRSALVLGCTGWKMW